MAKADNDFTLGNDVQVVLTLGTLGQITFSHVTEFSADPITQEIMVKRLNGQPLVKYVPGGWRFSFQIDRATSVADDTWALIEASYWNGIALPLGQMFQYIAETDGSQSTYSYPGVSVKLTKGGAWQQEQAVKQTIEGFAQQRVRV